MSHMFWKALAVWTLRASALLRPIRPALISRVSVVRGILQKLPKSTEFQPLAESKLPSLRLYSLRNLHTMSGGSTVSTKPIEYFRSNYKPSDFLIPRIRVDFELDEAETFVTARSVITKQTSSDEDLVLNGEELELITVKIDGIELSPDSYIRDSVSLRIPQSILPKGKEFTLETKVKVYPNKNFALSGLYKSGSSRLLSTQCEAMGFRRITYHLDRPDVLSTYTVRLQGNKERYPILLSNGNEVERGEYTTADGQKMHFSVWEDPFPKPCYLFALVAGDLGSIHSSYTTTSGRVVKLGIYSDKENANQLEHAMYSIKASMKWDEDTFGLECDLDTYNIVATNDFNMGAMENKGLNIFNSAYTLADPSTATDVDFERILGIIGHEYFHNWTGNRVTVRDWFQLTLKEGLTVFRDQWFTSDLTSAAVKRIEDVRGLRSRQFAEDAGPLAHPIRPESYISMDNFYTGTVYVKGAEVVRLYRTLLGEEGFKKGMRLYFQRHEGQAVTCEDFRNAMADANGVDLSQMERWYAQAGTPVVRVEQHYDAATQRLTLRCSQHTPSTPGQRQEDKLPLLIPLVTGLLDRHSGKELVPSAVLRLTEAVQEFHFDGLITQPVVSILRDFSAPVKLEIEQSDAELCLLMAHDTDAFNRWDAGNRYCTKLILDLAAQPVEDIQAATLPGMFMDAVRSILQAAAGYQDPANGVDPSLAAYALQLPDLATLLNQMPQVDIDRLHAAHRHVKNALVTQLGTEFERVYTSTAAHLRDAYQFTPAEVGRRRLQNTCLDYLTSLGTPAALHRAKTQFDTCTCMTDKLAALSSLASHPGVEREAAMAAFFKEAAGKNLVVNKWFAVQACADHPGVLQQVRALKEHPDFLLSNPNRARALIGTFSANLPHFHAADGSGYAFVADCIMEIDRLNPQVAARMVTAFAQWKAFDAPRQALMQAQLRRIQAQEKLSKDTLENVLRCLK